MYRRGFSLVFHVHTVAVKSEVQKKAKGSCSNFMLCTAMPLLSASMHSITLTMTNSYMPLQGHKSDWLHHDICMHIVTGPFLFDGLQYQFYCYEGQMSIFVCISVYTVVKRVKPRFNFIVFICIFCQDIKQQFFCLSSILCLSCGGLTNDIYPSQIATFSVSPCVATRILCRGSLGTRLIIHTCVCLQHNFCC